MMALRPMDGEDLKLFVEPHVQMLAQDWRPRRSSESPGRKRQHRLHLTARHHHFHLPLHPAH